MRPPTPDQADPVVPAAALAHPNAVVDANDALVGDEDAGPWILARLLVTRAA